MYNVKTIPYFFLGILLLANLNIKIISWELSSLRDFLIKAENMNINFSVKPNKEKEIKHN